MDPSLGPPRAPEPWWADLDYLSIHPIHSSSLWIPDGRLIPEGCYNRQRHEFRPQLTCRRRPLCTRCSSRLGVTIMSAPFDCFCEFIYVSLVVSKHH
jgi:hypothetical protein